MEKRMPFKPSAATLQNTIDGWRFSDNEVISLMVAGKFAYGNSKYSTSHRAVTVLEALEMETESLGRTVSAVFPEIDQADTDREIRFFRTFDDRGSGLSDSSLR
jgi:hypothetical protein